MKKLCNLAKWKFEKLGEVHQEISRFLCRSSEQAQRYRVDFDVQLTAHSLHNVLSCPTLPYEQQAPQNT